MTYCVAFPFSLPAAHAAGHSAVLSVSAMTCPDSFPFPARRFESFKTACGRAGRPRQRAPNTFKNNWMVTADRLERRRVPSPQRSSSSIPASAASRCCVRSSAPGPTPIMSMSPTTRSFPMAITARSEIIARVVPLIGELIAAHAPDLVVIACNTASTLVMSHLREAYRCAVRRHRARDQAGLRQLKDQARVGARHQGHREARIHQAPDPRIFAQGCEVTLVGSAELASLAESALSGNDVSDADIAAELAPCFVGSGAMTLPAPTPWCWPARIIRCCWTG